MAKQELRGEADRVGGKYRKCPWQPQKHNQQEMCAALAGLLPCELGLPCEFGSGDF